MAEPGWVDVGSGGKLAGKPLQTASVGPARSVDEGPGAPR